MKKIIFVLFLMLGAGSLVQAQVLNKLKTKTKAAAASSADRSADKVVDKTVNKTVDNSTDKVLSRADEKLHNIFKKKNKKKVESTEPAAPVSDSTASVPGN